MFLLNLLPIPEIFLLVWFAGMDMQVYLSGIHKKSPFPIVNLMISVYGKGKGITMFISIKNMEISACIFNIMSLFTAWQIR